MVYKVIGLMSGSSLDGLDIVFVHLQETSGKWTYEIMNAECYEYDSVWRNGLKNAETLTAMEYQILHADYGHYLGEQVNRFIEEKNLHHQIALVASHGHTTFHLPSKSMTAQLGDGAALAAETQLPVVTDLRSMDVAFGGEGAPIVPIGEKLLFNEYDYFLNLGGIANISAKMQNKYVAFDVCAANRVLNMIAEKKGVSFDDGGKIAAKGKVNDDLLDELNNLEYYRQPFPKSLANSFGVEIVFPLIDRANILQEDAMRTYVEHICCQVKNSIENVKSANEYCKLLVTGGGAFNFFLTERLQVLLNELLIEVVIPEENLVKYKEALIMALIGTLRWREEYNVLSSVTGAKRNSTGGALWLGSEA